MTDLELVRKCAEAMGLWPDKISIAKGNEEIPEIWGFNCGIYPELSVGYYWPLHYDAQAMALIKKFNLHIDQRPNKQVSVQDPDFTAIATREDCDLNRAICECVAQINLGGA